jgi:hypothetical protein
MQDHDFVQSQERTSAGAPKNACTRCGKTAESHLDCEIQIWFQHRLYTFKNLEEARERGFYLI